MSAYLITFCSGGDLVGYGYVRELCATGDHSIRYVELDGTESSDLPAGWERCGGGSLLTFCTADEIVGYAYAVEDCEAGTVTVEYLSTGGTTSASALPTNWELCGTDFGDAVTGPAVGVMTYTWGVAEGASAGTFQDDGASPTYWPDGGLDSADSDERFTTPPIAGGYTTWTFQGIRIVVHNVQGALSDSIIVSLQDESAVAYATVTIAGGTSPDSPSGAAFIDRSATGTGVATATTRLQWVIQSAPAGNLFWVEATAIGILS